MMPHQIRAASHADWMRKRLETYRKLNPKVPPEEDKLPLPGSDGEFAARWLPDDSAEDCGGPKGPGFGKGGGHPRPVVIDLGSDLTKIGFAGMCVPESVFPSIVGRPKAPGVMVGMGGKDCFVSEEAFMKRGILKLKYPVEHGHVTNWNDTSKLIEHAYSSELKVSPAERPMCMLYPPDNPPVPYWDQRKDAHRSPWRNEEKRVEFMFENFQVPSLFCCKTLQMTLFASGLTCGTVVHSGGGTSLAMSFDENSNGIRKTFFKLRIGGRDMVQYLVRILALDRGYEMTTSQERMLTRVWMEHQARVSADFEAEERLHKQLEESGEGNPIIKYELIDGNILELTSAEHYRPAEILFQPMMIGSEEDGLSEILRLAVENAVWRGTAGDVRLVALGGGVTTCPGFARRLEADVPGTMVVPTSATTRKYSSWIGASVVSCLDSFKSCWISKESYEDSGKLAAIRRYMVPEKKWSEHHRGIRSMVVPFDDEELLDERIAFVLALSADDRDLHIGGTLKIKDGFGSERLLFCPLWG